MTLRVVLLLLAVMAALAAANTESLRVILEDNRTDKHQPFAFFAVPPASPRLVPLAPSYDANMTTTDRIVTLLAPKSRTSRISHSYLLQASVGPMFELRVCWPASFPAKFGLSFVDHRDGSGVVTVSYEPDYVSQVRDLMLQTPIPGRYELVANAVWMDALPLDAVGILWMLPLGGFIAYHLSTLILKWI